MNKQQLIALTVTALSASAAFAASWTTTYLPADGQTSPAEVDSTTAIGNKVSVANAGDSASVAATTGEGLFRANLDRASGSDDFGALSLGMPSDTAAPALQAGANVSFAGRETARAGWDYSWLGLTNTNAVNVTSGAMSVRDLTLPANAISLTKTGAGDLAIGSIPVSVVAVAVEGGTLSLGRATPAATEPAANPIVWLAADRLRAEDIVEDNGTNYLARWFDARGADAPATVDNSSLGIRSARPMSTSSTTQSPVFLADRTEGPYPTVVANGLNGKPVIDFGTPWFKNDGYDWASTDSAFMGLEKTSDGSFVTSDFAKEVFIVVAQNSKYDVPVVWSHNKQFLHSNYGSVKNNTQGGGSLLSSAALGDVSAKTAFGLWSIDAVPVSPLDSTSFSTAKFKNGSYHLVSFKATSTGGRSSPTLIASDRFNQNGVGGVRVAEVISYYRELTDAERTQTQKYLMDKWGLGTHPAAHAVALDSASVASGATLAYAGEGTMTIAAAAANGVVAAKSGTLSLAQPGIDAGAVLHLDASQVATLDTFTDGGKTYVRSWRDVRDNGFVAYSVTNTSETAANDEASYTQNIAPYVLVTALPTYHEATVGSKTMPCVDFGDMYKGSAVTDGSSATMLFNRAIDFAEGYIVFFDNNTTGDGQRMTIWGLHNNKDGMSAANFDTTLVRGKTTMLFSSGNAGLVKNNRIQLVAIDGVAGSASTSPTRNVFHQYTLGLDRAISQIRSFGRDTDNRYGGLKVCEAIAFSTRLDEARRKRIEQYLMDKWFGAAHPDAATIVQETMGGVSVASGATMAIDGDVTFASGGTLSFEIGEDSLPGTATVSGAVAFAGPQTLTVTSGASLAPGEYALISADSMATPDFSSWTFSLPESRTGLTVAVKDGALVLKAIKSFTMLIFK